MRFLAPSTQLTARRRRRRRRGEWTKAAMAGTGLGFGTLVTFGMPVDELFPGANNTDPAFELVLTEGNLAEVRSAEQYQGILIADASGNWVPHGLGKQDKVPWRPPFPDPYKYVHLDEDGTPRLDPGARRKDQRPPVLPEGVAETVGPLVKEVVGESAGVLVEGAKVAFDWAVKELGEDPSGLFTNEQWNYLSSYYPGWTVRLRGIRLRESETHDGLEDSHHDSWLSQGLGAVGITPGTRLYMTATRRGCPGPNCTIADQQSIQIELEPLDEDKSVWGVEGRPVVNFGRGMVEWMDPSLFDGDLQELPELPLLRPFRSGDVHQPTDVSWYDAAFGGEGGWQVVDASRAETPGAVEPGFDRALPQGRVGTTAVVVRLNGTRHELIVPPSATAEERRDLVVAFKEDVVDRQVPAEYALLEHYRRSGQHEEIVAAELEHWDPYAVRRHHGNVWRYQHRETRRTVPALLVEGEWLVGDGTTVEPGVNLIWKTAKDLRQMADDGIARVEGMGRTTRGYIDQGVEEVNRVVQETAAVIREAAEEQIAKAVNLAEDTAAKIRELAEREIRRIERAAERVARMIRGVPEPERAPQVLANGRLLLARAGRADRYTTDGTPYSGEVRFGRRHHSYELGERDGMPVLFEVSNLRNTPQDKAIADRKIEASRKLFDAGFGPRFFEMTEENGRLVFEYAHSEGEYHTPDRLHLHPRAAELLPNLQRLRQWAYENHAELGAFGFRIHPDTLDIQVVETGHVDFLDRYELDDPDRLDVLMRPMNQIGYEAIQEAFRQSGVRRFYPGDDVQERLFEWHKTYPDRNLYGLVEAVREMDPMQLSILRSALLETRDMATLDLYLGPHTRN